MIRTLDRMLFILRAGLWTVVDADVCAVDRHKTLHAVNPDNMQKLDRRYKQRTWVLSNPKVWPTTCGARVTAVFVWEAFVGTESDGFTAVPWPPPVKGAEDNGFTRCRDCWVATGSKRPHRAWKSLKVLEQVAA